MAQWHKTGCVLCAQNCGLEVNVANNRMAKVRPDKSNPRSRGYACRKGLNVAHHQHHADRLTHPLKRTATGFERISWNQAIAEISQRLKTVVNQHGPRSYAYMGGGGQGCHFEAAFGRTLMKLLGSQYHYNAVAQELTGYFWACGRHIGRQSDFHIPDEANADMLLAVGWNGMESHQMPRAPLVLKAFSKDPDKLLVVIDPRLDEGHAVYPVQDPRPGAGIRQSGRPVGAAAHRTGKVEKRGPAGRVRRGRLGGIHRLGPGKAAGHREVNGQEPQPGSPGRPASPHRVRRKTVPGRHGPP